MGLIPVEPVGERPTRLSSKRVVTQRGSAGVGTEGPAKSSLAEGLSTCLLLNGWLVDVFMDWN